MTQSGIDPLTFHKSTSFKLYSRRVRCAHSVLACSLSHNNCRKVSRPGSQRIYLNPVQISHKHRLSIQKANPRQGLILSPHCERQLTNRQNNCHFPFQNRLVLNEMPHEIYFHHQYQNGSQCNLVDLVTRLRTSITNRGSTVGIARCVPLPLSRL